MKTMLVTGGAGFIGANFINYELERRLDMNIVCFDKLTYAGNLLNLEKAAADPRYRFIRGDAADAEAVRRAFRAARPDIVVNFAAESHVDRSISDPGIFVRTNVAGTQVLMDCCLEFGVERFHQVSTDEVYGDLPLDRPDLRFTEDTPLCASSPYSASKAGADLLVGAYHRTYGLNATISRCSNNYGPYQFPEKLIPLLASNAMANKPLPIYGAGENVRDWIYVEDHCRAIDLIIFGGEAGRVYNVGADCEKRNIDIARRICRELRKPEKLITFVSDRPGHDLRYAMDSSRIRRELGWEPRMSFEDGLSYTIGWYLHNRSWFNKTLSGEYAALSEKLEAI
jgi:dTDP-glucose 4,6-dehydratase